MFAASTAKVQLPRASIYERLLPIDLAIVLPTYNERDNVGEILSHLEEALDGLHWEVIFVDDDSPDGTPDVVRSYARNDSRVRLVHRIGRRGLSSACIEGVLATSANYVAVMDADLQHDETILPLMLQKLHEESLDIVIGTRNAQNGSMGDFCKKRVVLSRLGKKISNLVCRCDLSDPMSGFFLMRRSFFLEIVHELQGSGFKILVDMMASSQRDVRVGEVGYCFRNRRHGESKLDINTGVEYLLLVVNKLMRGFIPLRLAVFSLVATIGVALQLLCLAFMLYNLHLHFAYAQFLSTLFAITGSFFLNNALTFRDRSLRGVQLASGLLTFWIGCAFGIWANVVFAGSLLHAGEPWYIAGLAGIVISSVWNYSITTLFATPASQPRRQQIGPVEELSADANVYR